MKLVIAGTGYVGLVTGACLADVGHRTTCVDIDAEKVEKLRKGLIDIFEPGLENLVKNGLQSGYLSFTVEMKTALAQADAVYIAVGTPPQPDGSSNLDDVLGVAELIGQCLDQHLLVIIKSTVPAGTCHRVKSFINDILLSRQKDFYIEVASNPEFLKEGSAVADFTHPDRIIAGVDSVEGSDALHKIYAPYNRKGDKIIYMDVVSAELTKYAANAMLATKISFMNEMANIAERVGADIEQVRLGIGSDPRIGYNFIHAGCGYGGACFPKDIKSLAALAKQHQYHGLLLEAVDRVNENQKTRLFQRLHQHFGGALSGKCIALWGLAFKPNTNDIRGAPSRALMEALWQAGASVKTYDPAAMPDILDAYGPRPDLLLCDGPFNALLDADALVICTEWDVFKVPDYDAIKRHLRNPVIVDGRNLYDPRLMKQKGFTYYGMGRGDSCATP